MKNVLMAFLVTLASALSIQAICQKPTLSSAKVELKQQEFKEHKGTWEIDVRFPALKGHEPFNRAVHQCVKRVVYDFKHGLPKTDAEGFPDYGSYLHGTYEAVPLQNDVISVLFSFGEYSSGAVHPWGVLRSIVYDTKRRRTVSLADLFQPGTSFVQRLSELAVKSLEQNEYAERQAIHQGAGPIESNFKVFTLTETALVLHFQQYQVAAGAAGEQEVSIPLSTLSPILQNRFRTSRRPAIEVAPE